MTLIPLLLVLGLVFAGFLAALRYVLMRYATQATGHLQSLSQETLAQQELLKRKLGDVDRQRQEQLAKVQEEAQQMKAKALQEAEAARQQAVAHGREEAERIVAQANQARESLEREWKEAMHSKVVEQAFQMLGKVLPSLLGEMVHVQWLDALLQDGLIDIERLDTKEEIHEAQVISAVALTPAQRKLLQDRLRQALGRAVELKESVDPGLIAGVKIMMGHTVLDGTLASRLKEVAQREQDAVS
ncbi:MAG: F0F1 ATP synthase subunit delta [Candidatus Omnitrophica bacterium]|nr:F0F1 ATP synthase subunit delta [Candidatus Omnitrophota bacterium]